MMKASNLLFPALLLAGLTFTSCEKNEVFDDQAYACDFTLPDPSADHPKAAVYQNILDNNRKNGIVGAVMYVRDGDGLWVGADGYADIASEVRMRSCNTFLIASISKVLTSAAVYRYIDAGILTLDAPIANYLDPEVVDEVENADQAQIKHLLAHTSGIADYYTFAFELDRINAVDNDFTMEEVLEYTYGANATGAVGETYYYSNTNFLLLAMILEQTSGKSFAEVYQEEVFDPLGLASGYYGVEQTIPDGCVKGYVDIYNNGQFVESEWLYGDELGIGGDGGVAINAWDLATFFENLDNPDYLSPASYAKLTEWFDLPEDWAWETDPVSQLQNGIGTESFHTPYGQAVGHSGGIDGFGTWAFHFPEDDKTLVILLNSVGNEAGNDALWNIMEETLAQMFE